MYCNRPVLSKIKTKENFKARHFTKTTFINVIFTSLWVFSLRIRPPVYVHVI